MNFDTILRGREFWNIPDLVKTGLFRNKSSVHHLMRKKEVQTIVTSERGRVITRESLIRYLKKLNQDKT